jgi:uncharacterized membrane protein YoaK (UPF0700 family)
MEQLSIDRERRRIAFTLLLATVAGSVDSIGFLLLAQIFVAHITGDSVTLAVDLSSRNRTSILPRVIPILLFMAGVAAGCALMHHGLRHARLPALSIGLGIEVILVLATMLVGLLAVHNAPVPSASAALYVALAPVAVAMGFQNTIIRDARWRSVHTTYMTGAVVTAVEEAVELALRGGTPGTDPSGFPLEPSVGRLVLYGGVYCCYVVAAFVGALFELRLHFWAFGLPLAGLLAALLWDRVRPFYL